MNKPWILGLTGGIGSGKSAVAAHFSDLGVHLVDADQAARWVVEPGRPALAKIAEHFGREVLLPDGQLDRAALRQRIFENVDERRWLESLLHPLIPFQPAPQPGLVGKPILVTAGRRDGMCPAPQTEALVAWLKTQGADVTLFWHDGGHEIRQEELLAVQGWLSR